MTKRLTPREKRRYEKILAATIDLLKLGEWTINVSFCDPAEVEEALADSPTNGYGSLGFSWWHPDETRAYIGVAWPSIHKEAGAEWEDTLIHELVHVRLGGGDYCEGRSALSERNVNIVTALVRKVLGV